MKYGTFPSLPGPPLPGSPLFGSKARSSGARTGPQGALEVDSARADRRAFIVGLSGLIAGTVGGSLLAGWGTGGVDSGAGRSSEVLASDESNEEGLPSWASEMKSMDDETLLLMAGEFERRSARHRKDSEAAPGFERLLSLALSSRRREADMAAACAIRSLQRLGRTDLVAIWADDVRRQPQLSEANQELEDILDRALRKRRRLIPR